MLVTASDREYRQDEQRRVRDKRQRPVEDAAVDHRVGGKRQMRAMLLDRRHRQHGHAALSVEASEVLPGQVFPATDVSTHAGLQGSWGNRIDPAPLRGYRNDRPECAGEIAVMVDVAVGTKLA